MPELDDRDREIIAGRVALMDSLGPQARVGDWLRFEDGKFVRVTHVWDNGVQTWPDGGSYHLTVSGHCSYSGSLDSVIEFDRITPTAETRDGSIWIFHHDRWAAHNGVDTSVPFRVYDCKRPDHYRVR